MEAALKRKEIRRRLVLLLDPDLQTIAQRGKYPADQELVEMDTWQFRDASLRSRGLIIPEDREFLYSLARITWPDPPPPAPAVRAKSRKGGFIFGRNPKAVRR